MAHARELPTQLGGEGSGGKPRGEWHVRRQRIAQFIEPTEKSAAAQVIDDDDDKDDDDDDPKSQRAMCKTERGRNKKTRERKRRK